MKQKDKKIGIFEMTGCEGCEIAVSNQEGQIQELAKISSFPMKTNETEVKRMDIALIEGQVGCQEDLDLLEKIREKAKYLVAIGTCATEGNYPEAVNEYGVESDIEREELGKKSEFNLLEKPGSLEDFVEVDYYLRGCPVREKELLQFLEKFGERNFQKNDDLQLPFLSEKQELDLKSDVISYNPNKCILCRRCVRVCNESMGVHAIGMSDRGPEANVSTPFGESLDETECIYCGQCIENCPVGAFDVSSSVKDALDILEKENEKTIIVVDPVSLVSLGNVISSFENDLDIGLSKMINALRDMGADEVLDYSSFLQLSAVAQAELLEDEEKIVSSWCPSGRFFVQEGLSEVENSLFDETFPENILLSYVQSEHGEENVNIILISPCVAQKKDDLIDVVITPRKIPQFLGAKNIWLDAYPNTEADFDEGLVPRSRKMLQGQDNIAFSPHVLKIVSKLDSPDSESSINSTILENNVKEYTLEVGDNSYKGLVVREPSKARQYFEGDEDFDIIEVIPCPAGCATGGGQFPTSSVSDVESRFEKLEELNERVKPSKNSFVDLVEDYKNLSGGS